MRTAIDRGFLCSGLLTASLVLSTGCTSPPDSAIRDVRPVQIERDDKVIVEANGALFTVGAPTTVTLDALKIAHPGRAVAPSRVLFDADEALHDQVRALGGHVVQRTTVTVEQTVGGEKRTFKSSPSDTFEVDLFPRSLQDVSKRVADRATGEGAGSLWEWMGARGATVQGGVQLRDVVHKVDREALLRRYDTPPLDGKISFEEAKVGWPSGMNADEFRRIDTNDDRALESWEIDALPLEDGLAAAAGAREYDLVTSVDGVKVASIADLAKAWDAGSAPTVALGVTHLDDRTTATISLPRYGHPTEIPGWLIFALCMAIAATLIALPVPVIGGLIVVWERKISAYMQSRVGPNRVGPNGWLQWLADGLKLIMKEDLIPAEADPILFRASPYLAFVGLFLVFMVLPFTQWVIVADLNVGLLFLLSVTSLVVVSIIMGGWSSNSKWSLLGGMRSAAQIISYELPASVALLTIATLTGSLSTESIVRAQGGAPWNWYMFQNPFTFVAFFIYFISALAEGNRTPFDLPEAESELVSGYNTEYSGFRFSLFPLVEWVNLFVIGAVAAMLFCGGWRIPLLDMAKQDASAWLQLAGFGVFLAKIIFFVFVIIWIRWTLPRFRVDQMMNLCWKFFIPISFACFVGVLAFVWLVPPGAQMIVHYLTFAVGGLIPAYLFIRRVQYNRSRYQELKLNPLL